MAEITDKDIEETKRIYGFKPSQDVHTDSDIEETKRAAGVSRPSTRVYITGKPFADLTEQVVTGMPIIGGLMDKAVAATGAGIQGVFPKSGPEETPDTFYKRYEKNLEEIKRNQEEYRSAHPVLATGANVIGGTMATAPLMATKIGGTLLGTYGPTMGSKAITGGAGNALIGALDATTRGEDPIKGGIIGGATGAAGPIIGEGVSQGARALFNNLWPRQGVLRGVNPVAINHLTGALEGETPSSISMGLNRMGPQGFFGDVSPRLTDIAGGLADTPGPSKSIVRQAYLDRSSGQAARIDKALTEAAGPKFNHVEMKNMIMEERAHAADPLYEQFRTTSIHPTQGIKDLIPRLEKSGAFNLAEELAGIEGKNINKNFFTTGPQKSYPTAETWGYVKQGLNRRIDAAYDAGDKTLARSLVKLKGDLRTELEKAPGGQILKQADNEFASHSRLLDNFEAGRSTFLGGRSGISKEELAEELKTLSYPEYVARVSGMRQAADEAMHSTLKGDSTLRNKLLAKNNQEKIKLLLPGKRGEKLIQALENESFLADQGSNVIGNMQTGASGAMRGERVNALKPAPVREYNPSFTEPMSLIPNWLKDQFRPASITAAWRGQRQGEGLNQLAHLITTPAGPQLNELVAALSQESLRRQAVGASADRVGNVLTGAMTPASVAYRRNSP